MSMTEWRKTTLGQMFSLDNRKLGPKEVEPTVLSLSKYDGFVRSDEYFDKRIASASLEGYKVVRPGEWAFSTIHIDEGSIARNNTGQVGVISPMYTTMVWQSTEALPGYLELLVRAPAMLAEYGRLAQGSINRRRSLPFKTFSGIEVTLPPLPEQRRIVDVMSAVDAQIEALEEESVLHESVYRSVLTSLVTQYPLVPIADVVTRATSGGTPSRKRAVFFGGDIPWLKSGEVEDDRIETAKESITEAGLAASAARLVPAGATLVAMYGQGDTKGRAGYVTSPVATNQAVLALTPNEDRVHAHYLLHAVRSRTDALRQRAVGAAQPNLSKALVIATEIPLPLELDDQERLANGLDSIRNLTRTVRAELESLRAFRSSLLTALLSQSITIPEAYDAVLEVSA